MPQGAAPRSSNSLPGGHSEREPPDPIPNSEVKTLCADGSVPLRHARVGHRQASNKEPLRSFDLRGFLLGASCARPARLHGSSVSAPYARPLGCPTVSRTRQTQPLKIKLLIVRVTYGVVMRRQPSYGQQVRASANTRNFSGLS